MKTEKVCLKLKLLMSPSETARKVSIWSCSYWFDTDARLPRYRHSWCSAWLAQTWSQQKHTEGWIRSVLSEQPEALPVFFFLPNSLTRLISLSPDLFPPLFSPFQCRSTGQGPRSFWIFLFYLIFWCNFGPTHMAALLSNGFCCGRDCETLQGHSVSSQSQSGRSNFWLW